MLVILKRDLENLMKQRITKDDEINRMKNRLKKVDT